MCQVMAHTEPAVKKQAAKTQPEPSASAAVAVQSPKTLQVQVKASETVPEAMGRLLVDPAVNAASTMQAYQGAVLGDDISLMTTIEGVRQITERLKSGDMSDVEGLLISQALSLQTIYTSLARRAQDQTLQRNLEAFLGLALKAQAQSRSTLQALVELKFPRQVSFVRQANITTGNQQVNNSAPAPAAEPSNPQNKLLEATDGEWLDTGASSAPGRAYSELEAVDQGNRAAQH